jgi:hypothetical protein
VLCTHDLAVSAVQLLLMLLLFLGDMAIAAGVSGHTRNGATRHQTNKESLPKVINPTSCNPAPQARLAAPH